MLNLICPKVRLCQKPLPHLSKKWAQFKLAKRWHFTSFNQDVNIIVGLKLLTTGTNMTTVLYQQGKKLNLVQSWNGDRRSNAYMQAPFKKKTEHALEYQYSSFVNFCEQRSVPKCGLISPFNRVGLKQVLAQT